MLRYHDVVGGNMKKLIIACVLGILAGQALAIETVPTRPKCLIKPMSCR